MGTEQKDRAVPMKVTGEAKYSVDVRLPGMLYAAIKCCPVWGGDVRSYNADAIKGRPGVRSVVRLPLDDLTASVGVLAGGVAVVADSWWHAHTALEALPIEWNDGPDASVSSASLFEDHFTALKQPGNVVTNAGDVDAAMGRAARVVERPPIPCPSRPAPAWSRETPRCLSATAASTSGPAIRIRSGSCAAPPS
jgi:isoquinoline 1-oxidoreductase beta subunit